MVEDEIKVFKNFMENKKLRNATKSIKFIFELLAMETEESKEAYIKQLHGIAEKHDFKLDLEIEGETLRAINWYYDNVKIIPNKNPITIISPINNTKPRRSPLSAGFRHEVFSRDNYRCLECGATNMDRILEVDHIIPVSQGGTDEMKNLQTLCIICNRAKANRAWQSLPETSIKSQGDNLN